MTAGTHVGYRVRRPGDRGGRPGRLAAGRRVPPADRPSRPLGILSARRPARGRGAVGKPRHLCSPRATAVDPAASVDRPAAVLVAARTGRPDRERACPPGGDRRRRTPRRRRSRGRRRPRRRGARRRPDPVPGGVGPVTTALCSSTPSVRRRKETVCDDALRLRLLRGRQGPEGPARRQGSEPGGDGEAGPARAPRVHDLHRGVPGLPGVGAVPEGLDAEIAEHLAALEAARGKKLGDPDDPLLVSVRSGAKFSMPGMMETVLNIGLNDESVHGLASPGGQPAVRVGLLPPADPDVRQDRAAHRRASGSSTRSTSSSGARASPATSTSTPTTCSSWSRRSSDRRRGDGHRVPAGPARAADRGDQRGVLVVELRPRGALPAPGADPERPGHRGERGGDGVRQHRPGLGHGGVLHPRPGHRRPGRLRRLPAERPGRGRRRGDPQHACPWPTWRRSTRPPTTSCWRSWRLLEGHYRDLCDIEFTIERGTLWMLQTRVGKRTAAAAFRIAAQLVDEGVIDADEAVRRVSGAQLAQLMFPQFDTAGSRTVLGRGIPASPGRPSARRCSTPTRR